MNILITGGTSGLGKALVLLLARDNANKVYFTYCKNEESARAINSQLENTVSLKLDYEDTDGVSTFIDNIRDLRIDVLINNAYSGEPMASNFHKSQPDEYEKAFITNVIPLIKITQVCILGMRKRKFGKIINIITSAVIDTPPLGYSVYACTKAYIRQLSKSICKENARFNITSNCILPDYMQTGFTKVADFQIEQMTDIHPLKRLLQPEEVACVIKSVIQSSQQLNGVEIPINAAQHIM